MLKYEGDPPPPRYEKPTLGVVPKRFWLEHRARELADYVCRMLDVPEPDLDRILEINAEIYDVIKEAQKERLEKGD